jgi:hypothetical protein
MFADDGMAFRDMAEPLAGSAAYQAHMTKFYADNPKAVDSWTTRSGMVAASGDFAVQTGPTPKPAPARRRQGEPGQFRDGVEEGRRRVEGRGRHH